MCEASLGNKIAVLHERRCVAHVLPERRQLLIQRLCCLESPLRPQQHPAHAHISFTHIRSHQFQLRPQLHPAHAHTQQAFKGNNARAHSMFQGSYGTPPYAGMRIHSCSVGTGVWACGRARHVKIEDKCARGRSGTRRGERRKRLLLLYPMPFSHARKEGTMDKP